MKLTLKIFLFFVLCTKFNYAQIGIGTNTPNNSAKLEISASDKGFLAPRVALTASNSGNPITSPATGLIVYNTATAGSSPYNVSPGYYYYDGSIWVSMSASTIIPAGSVQTFAGNTAPLGYLVCDGAAVSRTVYANLFAAIGTLYGAGNGSTTFNLPDLRGRTIVALGVRRRGQKTELDRFEMRVVISSFHVQFSSGKRIHPHHSVGGARRFFSREDRL
jgi:hypothetical protein